MEQLYSELTLWHWLALALILFGIEMMTGTFDLLMVAAAAAITAAFTWLAPDAIAGWQAQLICFGLASVGMVIFGRTVLSGLRKQVEEHPTLNKRMAGLIGQRGLAESDFEAGNGRVKIGDTVWGAQSVEGEAISAGDTVVVEGARSTTAIVRRA